MRLSVVIFRNFTAQGMLVSHEPLHACRCCPLPNIRLRGARIRCRHPARENQLLRASLCSVQVLTVTANHILYTAPRAATCQLGSAFASNSSTSIFAARQPAAAGSVKVNALAAETNCLQGVRPKDSTLMCADGQSLSSCSKLNSGLRL